MKVKLDNGSVIDLGATETTPTISITDYSRRVTDDFGVTTVVRRNFSRKLSVRMWLSTSAVDATRRQLEDLRATPVSWIAADALAWLQVRGFYREFEFDLASENVSFCTLSFEGLAESETVADAGGDPAIAGRTSALRLLQPLDVTDSVLASSSVAENDAASWGAGTTYAKGARVTRAHRIYESLVAGNVGKEPSASPAAWLDTGPTNRWAMFDQALGTATRSGGSITVALNAGGARAIALLDVVATSVRVQATGYDRTLAPTAGSTLFLDLPANAGTITVTATATNQVAIGTLLLGSVVGLGTTEASATAGITDYSRKEADDFGAINVVPRAFAKRMSVRSLIRTDAVDQVANRIASVRARPCLWIADGTLDSVTIYGFFKDFSIEVGADTSKLSLTVEGLSKAQPLPKPPPEGPNVVAQGSVDAVNWHDGLQTGDVYMRLSTDYGATFGTPVRIAGEDAMPGEDGSYQQQVFKRSPTRPATPTGGGVPAGWSDGVPDGTDLIWLSVAYQRNGILLGPWSLPAQIKGDPGADTEVYSLVAAGANFGQPPNLGLLGAKGQTFIDPDYYADPNHTGRAARSYTVCWRDSPTVWHSRHFDLYDGSLNYAGNPTPPGSGIQGFYDCINAIPLGKVVAIYTWDEPSTNHLHPLVNSALSMVGAQMDVVSKAWAVRSAFVHVGVKGWLAGRGISIQSDSGIVQTVFSVVNGIPSAGKAGTDGLPGEDGKDGKTWYPYFAYADSPDGTVNFTTTEPGTRTYVGTATGTAVNEPTIPSLYTWSRYVGPPFGMDTRGTASVAGRTIRKAANAPDNWGDADAYSTNGYTGGAIATARADLGNATMMFGLNSDPRTDSSYSSLDFAWYLRSDNRACIYEDGQSRPTPGIETVFVDGYGAGKFDVRYNGRFVEYVYNDAVYRRVDVGLNRTFYFDCALASPGAALYDVDFASYSSNLPSISLQATFNTQRYDANNAPVNVDMTFQATRFNSPTDPFFSVIGSDGSTQLGWGTAAQHVANYPNLFASNGPDNFVMKASGSWSAAVCNAMIDRGAAPSYTVQAATSLSGGVVATTSVTKVKDGANGVGTPGANALNLTASVSSLTFLADYDGTLKSGQLAQVIVLTYTEGPNNVSTSVDWTIPEFSGCSGQMTSSGLVTFNSVSASGYFRVSGTYKGQTFTIKVPIVLVKDTPPANSDQHGSAYVGKTVSSSTYPGQPDSSLIVTVVSNQVRCTYDLTYSAGGQGNVYVEAMIGFRRAGTNDGWTTFPAKQGSQARLNNNNPAEPIDEQGNVNSVHIGTVSPGRWEVGVFTRRFQGAQTAVLTGRILGDSN
ncbi:hypothetical protein [Sphingomonas sp. BK069]|uniref:hypothetical protein n=1 Tax=Sphingomonas sp. BK069 TaxID=2586979 RepID=UPI0016098BE3|nr:hypothetical protein [Sphingomonas sp. BK069]MBB3347314.1 hypothetical protein [Sphingomonas sp. BK069]